MSLPRMTDLELGKTPNSPKIKTNFGNCKEIRFIFTDIDSMSVIIINFRQQSQHNFKRQAL